MAAQLKEIVDRLNAEPFQMELSLVVFDEKDPLELMEVLNQVLIYLDPKHTVDLREEKPDAMYSRISDFLHVLGYKCSYDMEFTQGLQTGDKATVHPILYWLLNNLEPLKRRSYLAKFCMNLEVPEEFLREEKVYEVYHSYKELQSQFKATHSHLERERQGRMNPAELQREVAQLDSEREQLQQKIQQLKSKTEKDEQFQILLKVTSMLRKEQEEEARLGEKLAEQRYQLEQTEQLYVEKSAKLRELREAQQADGEGSAEAMLKMQRSEVEKGREALNRVKRESEAKFSRLREIDAALSDPPVTADDIANLEDEIGSMQSEIQQLEATVNEHNQDSRLSVYKQQASLVAKRKDIVLKEQKELEAARDELGKELSAKEREYEQMKGHKHMNRDEFKHYAASLRDKSAKFKKLKAELSELRHEVAVLARTEDMLRAKDPTPQGLRETEMALEKASVEKSQVDKMKGKTLEEISSIVSKINTQLKEKKNKLAPQIKALRSVRQNFQQVEVKYLERKGAYESAKSAVDSELTKLAGDVKFLEDEVQTSEREYHELNMQINAADTRLARARREASCMRQEDRYSADFQTLSDEYKSQIEKLDAQCKDLRQEQKTVKETHEDKLKQKKAFVALEKLMQLKLKVSMQEAHSTQYGGMGMGMGMGVGARTMLDASTAGVERLVFEE
mmetsp:Transcript_8283/g.23772  ORF Transcript_8283/g.23772 Transcript_8283/m.23772 type:complete len:678 (-) Transcript_8283:30-2063(-)